MATPPKLGAGKSSKGVVGTWKKNAAGKLIFVAKTAAPAANAPPVTPVLSVDRYKTWSPTHQAQALKFYGDPSISTADFYKLAPAKQRELLARVRAGGIAAGQPGSALAPQSQNQINIAAEQAANLKYGATQRQNLQDQGSSDIQQGRITQWFKDYQDTITNATDNAKAASDAAQTQVATDSATSEAAAKTANDSVAASMAADAKSRGVDTVDPTIAANAVQAAASRQSTADTLKGMIGATGVTDYTSGQGMRGIAANQGVQAHLGESANKKALKQKLSDLLTEKGQYEGTTRQDLTAAERKNALETAAYQLDVATAGSKSAAAGAKLNKYGFSDADWAKLPESEKKKYRDGTNKPPKPKTGYGPGGPTLNKFGYTYDEWTKMSKADQDKARAGKGKTPKGKKPATGPGSLSSSAENKVVGQVSQLVGIMQHPPRWPGGPLKGQLMTAEDVRKHYLNTGTDPRIVHVATSLFRNNGQIGPDGISNAHALGIHVGGRWKQVKTPKAAAPSASNYGGGAGAGSGST